MQEIIKSGDQATQSLVINRAELDVQISTAKAYPRNIDQCIGEALSIIKSDKETAESCFYVLPARKNKDGTKSEPIKGASVRLAEVVSYAWGNLHAATRETNNDGKFVTVEGVCWDLQKNVKMMCEIKRSIKTKTGATYGTDMQAVTSNAAQSIALRNAVFRVIPKHIVNLLCDEAMKTAVGDAKSLGEMRAKEINLFVKSGIEKERIFGYFGVSTIDEITQANLSDLIGIRTAIKEGRLTKDNCFDVLDADTGEVESPNLADMKNEIDGA